MLSLLKHPSVWWGDSERFPAFRPLPICSYARAPSSPARRPGWLLACRGAVVPAAVVAGRGSAGLLRTRHPGRARAERPVARVEGLPAEACSKGRLAPAVAVGAVEAPRRGSGQTVGAARAVVPESARSGLVLAAAQAVAGLSF